MSQAMPRDGAIIFADLIGKLERAVQVRAIEGVAENQKSERSRCYAGAGWDVLIAATLSGIDLVIAVPPRQTICS